MTKGEVSELYKVMFTEYPDLLSINELRHMLGVSKHKAYDLINDGSINAIKIGNAFRIPKINVINYVLCA
jgi:excisionase family DNA binding protein